MIILPSIIAISQHELDERIMKVKKYFSTIHIDIMDGKFVGNHSLNFDFALPFDVTFEVHLMVEHPELWIYQNIEHFPCIGTFFVHIESCSTPFALIQFVKQHKKKIGFVLNPETAIEDLTPFVELIDYVLFMTVIPGQYGAVFVPAVLEKIQLFHKMHSEIEIQVDGSVNQTTIGLIAAAGATRFVVGSYLQNVEDISAALSELYSSAATRNSKV